MADRRAALDALLRARRVDPADPRVELAIDLFRDGGGSPERLADEVAALLRWEAARGGPVDRLLDGTGARHALAVTRAAIRETPELDAEGAAAVLERATRASGLGRRILEHSVRLALTGRSQGPDLSLLIAALGRDEVARRLDQALGAAARRLA